MHSNLYSIYVCIILDTIFESIHPPGAAPLSYELWLPDWLSHLTPVSIPNKIPLAAHHVQTPLITRMWSRRLQDHPHQELVRYFLESITNGFRIRFCGKNLHAAKKNLQSALAHPNIVDEYLQHELSLGRMSGPYHVSLCPGVHVSRFGVIPKNHHPDKWRLITDLSHPQGQSINDGIQPHLCSLSYVTIDDAILSIIKLGAGTALAKIDIKNAFRLLPVHPSDRHLLTMKWRGYVYIDHCIPFGLRSAPKLFNILADLLSWIAQTAGVSYLIHYLDDYLTMGPPSSSVCQQNLDLFITLCRELGVPLASEKLEGPTTTLLFLGIILDTNRMEIRLPEDKLSRTQEMIRAWLPKRKATKREILSLVGTLQHATKVVKAGRTFVSRMYATAAKLQKMHFFTRLNVAFRSDLFWWHIFLQSWNGLSILYHPALSTPPDFIAQTDASGSWGCAAVLDNQWLQWQWPLEWVSEGIMAKELIPIIFACVAWGMQLSRHHINFQCDNASLVAAINKGSAKDKLVMHLLRCMWFFIAHLDISVTATHLLGTTNVTADHLSRGKTNLAHQCTPTLCHQPSELPHTIFQLLSPQGLDWTSTDFLHLFQETLLWIHKNNS